MEEGGGLGCRAWGGEGARVKAAELDAPRGAGMEGLPLLLLVISPVAVSAPTSVRMVQVARLFMQALPAQTLNPNP